MSGPARSWAYRVARAHCWPEQAALTVAVVDLLCGQPGLLRRLADETETPLPVLRVLGRAS